MATVYFATNRKPDTAAPFGFADTVADFDPQNITFGKVDVTGTNLAHESSGVLGEILDKTPANFSEATAAEILGAQKNLLFFIHGFDNSFEDAIKRAAFNQLWLTGCGDAHADTTIIAFSWPSAGKLLSIPPHMPPEAYRADQAKAGASAFHVAHFLRVIDQLQARYRNECPSGRVFLLAHSMGNHALSGAIQLWTGTGDPREAIFDCAILAAADEIAHTLYLPGNGQMTGLRHLAKRVSVYHSRIDVAMYLSTTVNLTQRLGYDGPPDKHDISAYPPAMFRFVDCTTVKDYPLLHPPDATHQYYRRSIWVRADIAAQFF
jgi:esterase/lipase superfamily enzyme